jgi:hypothetical protein
MLAVSLLLLVVQLRLSYRSVLNRVLKYPTGLSEVRASWGGPPPFAHFWGEAGSPPSASGESGRLCVSRGKAGRGRERLFSPSKEHVRFQRRFRRKSVFSTGAHRCNYQGATKPSSAAEASSDMP